MLRLVVALMMAFGVAIATMPLFDRTIIIFNKPSIKVESSTKELKSLANEFGFERVGLRSINGIWQLEIEGVSFQKIVKIGSICDLTSFFHRPECIKNWEVFHRCSEKDIDPEDEKLQAKIDREFYSWLICQGSCDEDGENGTEVSRCGDRIKWKVYWESPGIIRIEAEIGAGGFRTLEKARESLHRINEKLKSVLYGARFPESAGEERTRNELFWTESRSVVLSNLSKRVEKLLTRLRADGVIAGLSQADIASIAKKVGPGKVVYYEACGKPGSWKSVYTNVHLDFTHRLCPKKEVRR